MAADITKDEVLKALKAVKGPDGKNDIVSLGMVSEIVIRNGKVTFAIAVAPDIAARMEPLRLSAENTVKALPGVAGAMVMLTADREAGQGAAPAGAPGKGVAGVKHIIAVASGKGGVGKSTTAVNLALGFQANGLRVGLLDADIYGPSIPRLLQISGRPELAGENVLAPMENYGLKVMSMGFLIEEETPMIWRGPMVASAIGQLLDDVAWGDLDLIVVDMPPGTGDAQLTLAQKVPLAGAIIVSTPQDLALIDARKGLAMFRRVNVPVTGIVENMSYFLCPKCGHRADVFSHGGAREEAARLGVPFLGEVPLDMQIRETSDAGTPVVVSDPQSPHAAVYREMAAAAWATITGGKPQKAAPKIVVE